MPDLPTLTDACRKHVPQLLRWAGGIARRMRGFDISVGGQKQSGSRNTDALTLADLSCQELLIAGLRDLDPIFHGCRIEAEEDTGDLNRFAEQGRYVLAIDPIDGTLQYRDRTGDGYAVMLHLRDEQQVHYSLVYLPEKSEMGWWVEAQPGEIRTGPDDWALPADQAVRSIAPLDHTRRPQSNRIYVIGFLERDQEMAAQLEQIGLEGHTAEAMPGSIFDLLARGEYGGSLIHTPNVYDYPVAAQIARLLEGESVWVHSREPVHFKETWLDERADMLRLPGIVATAVDEAALNKLCDLAADWPRERYRDT